MLSRGTLGALALAHLSALGVPVSAVTSVAKPRTLDDAAGLGGLMAAVHRAFDSFETPAGGEIWSLNVDVLTGSDDAWLRRNLAESPQDLAVLSDWRSAARTILETHPATDIGLCHGEVYPATCQLREDGSLAIAELDWVGNGAREYDLATWRWIVELHRPEDAARLFDEFLAGYALVREPPLTPALRAWVAARHLWSLRLSVGFEDLASLRRRADFARSWPLA